MPMKRTQVKDALRNAWKQRVSWFAIVIIAMLSVMAYLGINFASHGIAGSGNAFYDETRFRDVEILSTLLLTPEDLDAILAVDGVEDVEGVLQTGGKIENGNLRESVDVISLTERINTPKLLEGRLPEKAGECAVEQPVLEALELSLGDTICITDGQGDKAAYLLQGEFVITGVVHHGDHACWPLQVPGNRYVLVLPDAFDREALQGCCMKAVIRVEDTAGLDRFDKAYRAAVALVTERLEELRPIREEIRGDQVRATVQTQLDEGGAELDAGLAELESARAELDEGWRALEAGERQIAESEKQLAAGKAQLDQAAGQLESTRQQLEAAENELKTAKATLDEGEREIRSAEAQLEEGKAALEDSWNQLEGAKASVRDLIRERLAGALGPELSDSIPWASGRSANVDNSGETAMDLWITEDYKLDLNLYVAAKINLAQIVQDLLSSEEIPEEVLIAAYEQITGASEEEYDISQVRSALADYAVAHIAAYTGDFDSLVSACQKWDEGHAEYLSGLSTYRDGLARYNAALAEYENGVKQVQEGRKAYEDGLRQYREKTAEYERGVAALEAGKKELEESRKKLEEGERQYAEGLAAYEDGAGSLKTARARLEGMDSCRWVILDAEGNPSYLIVRNGVDNIADMGVTFALVFVLVGALVIYATVGRIVEEQRRLVGATKALGLYNREIFFKYLAFGLSATILGMLLGLAFGYFGIQRIVLFAYGRYYVFGAGKNAFLVGMTALVLLIGTALSSVAVWSASSSLLRSTATQLMQEKTPDIRHKKRQADRSTLSLYSRLILRNMRSDKKRVAVTVISVAGCCALLVAGFTMRQSVIKALNAQFDEVSSYDLQIRFDPEAAPEAQARLETILADAGTDWMSLHTATQVFSSQGKLLSAKLLCGDLAELDRFYARLDPEKDKSLPLDGEGVWIHQRTAEMNGLSTGDTITIYDSGMKPYTVPVAGVFRLYAGQEMILSAVQYERIFGAKPEDNAFFVHLNGADPETLKTAVQGIEGVEEIVDIAETRALYQSFASVLNLIALMMVCIAGLMAYFILLNLVNMYINQKKRELTIMRVNGFTVREVNLYVLREMIVSTALGIAIGLGAGSLLGYRVIRLLEGANVRFMRGIQWETWLWAALITVAYAVIILMIALRKVKYLKLTDVA